MSAKKNILILMADQLNPRYLAAYGDVTGKTPNIDRLAREGVVFDSAYCNSPLCAPSRFALMSGQLPSDIGAFDNACELSADTPTWAHHLRAAGYRTLLSGKMHFCGPDQLHGFEERLTTDIYPADFGWTPDWSQPDKRLEWYHNMSSVTDAGPCVRTNQLDFDDEVVAASRQKLFDLARSADPRPFCLTVSLTHPHDPFATPQKYWDLFEGLDIPAPKVAQAATEDDPHSRRIRAMCAMQTQLVTAEQVRRARRAYYGSIAYVDEQFGLILQTLKDIGQDQNTIVLMLSDHGEMLGERGLWYKMNFFEGGCRVPLIVHSPGDFSARRVPQSVSHVDLLPTLLELTGAPAAIDPQLAGRSLLPHLRGSGGHDEVIAEYLGEGALAPVVMIRRGSYKFVHSPADPDQLYDLVRDPDELHNLARDPARAALLASMRQEVALRWDLDGLRQRVLRSQQGRRLIDAAQNQGLPISWDYQPQQDASRRYVRKHIPLDDIEAMSRFPRVGS
jgi:choline-sulfatase